MGRRGGQSEIIIGVDIGSTAIRVAVGQVTYSGAGQQPNLQVIGAVEVPSEGVHKGVVSSIDEVVSSLTHALEQTERLTGLPIEHAWVGVSGAQAISQKNRGVVAVAKPDGEISGEDVDRVVDAARTIAPPLNYEILHVLPSGFHVDGQTNIKDPAGMSGVRLEVEAQIIYINSSHIKNITKAVYRTGIDIDDIVLSILSSASVVATPRQKDLGVAVVNIGGATTSLVVYEGGEVIHTATIPIGSEHVTNDLAIGLRTSIDIAELVKLEYGKSNSKNISKKEKIDLSRFDKNLETEEVQLFYIAQIIEARMGEIMEKIDEEFFKAHVSRLLPAGVIFTGGGAKIDGLTDLAKDELGLPATIGYPIHMDSISDKSSDISFTTAIGLLSWAFDLQSSKIVSKRSRFVSSNTAIKKVQNIWKSLIP